MGTKRLSDAQAGFAGGLNTVGDPSLIRPDQATQLVNVRLSAYGAATRRGGTRVVSAALAAISDGSKGIFWESKNSVVLVCAGNGHLYTAPRPTVGATWTLTLTDQGAWAAYDGFAIFTDGTNESLYGSTTNGSLSKWNGTAISTPSGCPAVQGVVVYNNRLWGWRTTAAPTSLFYSNLSSAVGSIGGDSLGVAASGGGQIVVQTYGTSAIYACFVVGSSLMIATTNGLSRLTGFGQDDISVDPQAVSNECNILSIDAKCVTPTGAFISTLRGLYEITESSATLVGTPEAPDPTVSALALSTSPSATNLFFNTNTNEVWVRIDGVGTYIYNTVLRAWSGPWTGGVFSPTGGGGSTPFSIKLVSTLVSRIVQGPTFVYDTIIELDSPDYYKDLVASNGTGGSAYTVTIQPHRMFANERSFSKAWRWINVMATLGDTGIPPVVTAVSKNGGTSTTTLAVTATAQDVYYVRPGGTGPYLDVTITDAGVSLSQYASIGVEGFLLGER